MEDYDTQIALNELTQLGDLLKQVLTEKEEKNEILSYRSLDVKKEILNLFEKVVDEEFRNLRKEYDSTRSVKKNSKPKYCTTLKGDLISYNHNDQGWKIYLENASLDCDGTIISGQMLRSNLHAFLDQEE